MISVSYHLYCVTVYCFMHQQQQKKALHHHLESLKTPFCCLCRLAHSGTEYKTLCQKYVYDSLNTHKKSVRQQTHLTNRAKKGKKNVYVENTVPSCIVTSGSFSPDTHRPIFHHHHYISKAIFICHQTY